MIYLSGAIREEMSGGRSDLGFMLTPRGGHRPDLSRTVWAADTGCFTDPEGFSLQHYLNWLASHSGDAERCLFATAPDVVGDAVATLERSLPVLPVIREAGFRASLVAQDGLETLRVPWDAFDTLFLGGSTPWKLSHHARDLTAEAKRRGKFVHMGRVNSLLRLQTGRMFGCNSADGTYVAFGPDRNLQRLRTWLDAMKTAPCLNFA